MCRGAPARVLEVRGDLATVESDGQPLTVSLLGVADVGVGDFVFHHAGLALQRLRAEEAATVLEALAILDELFAELEDTQEAA